MEAYLRRICGASEPELYTHSFSLKVRKIQNQSYHNLFSKHKSKVTKIARFDVISVLLFTPLALIITLSIPEPYISLDAARRIYANLRQGENVGDARVGIVFFMCIGVCYRVE